MHPSQSWQLAQVNIARMKESLESELLVDFVSELDNVNAEAENSPGFVWRLKDDSGYATGIDAFNDPELIINMSVWESIEALAAFTYKNKPHLEVLKKRRNWFHHMEVSFVLWWVPAGHEPTLEEAKRKLTQLAEAGPSPAAFTFKDSFPMPEGCREATACC